MPRFLLLACLLVIGASAAGAQAPSAWRDPEEGCWYVISPQGSVAIRYRRDGTPDCPDSRSVSGSQPPTRVTPDPSVAGPARLLPVPSALSLPGAKPRGPGGPVTPVRTAVVSFVCTSSESAAPPIQRVRIDPAAMLLLVETAEAGAGSTESYSIDTNMDVWLGGRNRRDPRLGFVLTHSRGQLRIDWAVGGSLRAPVRSYEFRCVPDGNLT